MFKSIRKRNGHIVPFKIEKITKAVYKASASVGEPNWHFSESLAKEVVGRLTKKIKRGSLPTVEEIQDMVEAVLIDRAHAKVVKAYILYRQHRAEIRAQKEQILNKEGIDEVDKRFDLNALRVLASRYLRKNEDGEIIESPKELFQRVAANATIPSLFYDSKIYKKGGKSPEYRSEEVDFIKLENKYSVGKYKFNRYHIEGLYRMYKRFAKDRKITVSWQKLLDMFKRGYFDKYEPEIDSYYNLMINRRFLPNTPAIANFGNVLGQGSACFTLGIEDSIDKIMDSLKGAAIIFKSGGGCGYNFSNLRPEGDFVKSSGGAASGPISFMSMFDNMTDVIKQGGIRRGANMGILNSDHPDIEKFVHAKEGNKALRNFNISVMVKGEFWECLDKGKPYPLVNPRSGKVVAEIDPTALLDAIAYQAWESAEPGVLFHDRINENNPFLKGLGTIEATNPCGEVTLYPNESCNLGSMNVWSYFKREGGKKPYFDWQTFEGDVKIATRFLDNVVDINKYPLPAIEEMSLNTRKLGLGLMGLGDLMYEMDIPYNSKEGFSFMEKIMEFINYHSKVESVQLAKERGKLPYFDKTFYKEGRLPFSAFKDKNSWNFDWKALVLKIKKQGIRNGFTTVVAPTGSISMIAGCSSGIEPVFSLVFEKNVAIGNFYYVDSAFEERMQKEGLMDEALIKDVASMNGSVQNINYIPSRLKKIFVTAMDISPKDHVKVLASFQRWVDSSISKTTNLSSDASVQDMKDVYIMAHELGCKGATVYRDKSLKTQVLTGTIKKYEKKQDKKDAKDGELILMKDEKAKGLTVYHMAGAAVGSSTLGLSHAPDNGNGNSSGGEFKKCPSCKSPLTRQEGCLKCPSCGWGLCS